MDHITRNLWLGSQEDADGLVGHNPEAITAILNVRGPDAYRPAGRDQSAEHHGKAYKWIPAPDTGRLLPEHMEEAVAWLDEQCGKGERILIHCKHGISRSPGFLVVFMVRSGIASSFEEAKSVIAGRRHVLPATPMERHTTQTVLVSELTGLPNRKAFDRAVPSPFVAIVDVDRMKVFNNCYGVIAGDVILRRLAKILISVGLDAYYDQNDEFFCRGGSREELEAKLSRVRRVFGESLQFYADGRVQTLEGMTFSAGIGATLEEQRNELSQAKEANARKEAPEWLRRLVETSGHDPLW